MIDLITRLSSHSSSIMRRLLIALALLPFAATGSRASAVESLRIGDIPVLVSRPAVIGPHTRLVLLYHGFGEPASPSELSEAVPLVGLDSVAAYVNLPLVAERMPVGGPAALQALQANDFVNGLYFRSIAQAVDEMPDVVRHLAATYHLDVSNGIDLFGFSAGGSAVMLALIEGTVPVRAAVVVNAPFSVRQNVQTWEKVMGRKFDWNAASEDAARRFDVVRQAGRIAARNPRPAVLIMQADADPYLSVEAAREAETALVAAYRPRGDEHSVQIEVLPATSHNFARRDERVQRAVIRWLRR